MQYLDVLMRSANSDARRNALGSGATMNQARALYACVLALFAICCVPVWFAPALPMQDYPQHLFLVAVLRGDVQHAYSTYYDSALSFAPYTGFYWFGRALAGVLGVDGAGRAFVTLYFALIAVLVLMSERAARRAVPTPAIKWSALAFFAFAIHQEYFHGFLGYLITLPLLFLALHGLREASVQRWGAACAALQLCLLGLMLWFHPLSIYLYALLALFEITGVRAAQTPLWLRVLPVSIALAVLWTWQAHSYRDASDWQWWPWRDTAGYLAQLAYGLRKDPGSRLVHVLGFAAITLSIVFTKPPRAIDKRDVLQLGALLTIYWVLPYRVGSYSYVNWRIAPLIYWQVARLIVRVPLGRWSQLGLVVGVLACTLDAVGLQWQVGREAAEILPLVRRVRPAQRVAAISFDDSSAYLDPKFFYLMHHHDIFYYQLLAGGVSPHLWQLPLVPVHYKHHVSPRVPRSLSDLIAGGYEVVFARHAVPGFATTLAPAYDLRARHGAWSVFERRGALR
jgi:hypothetical protein